MERPSGSAVLKTLLSIGRVERPHPFAPAPDAEPAAAIEARLPELVEALCARFGGRRIEARSGLLLVFDRPLDAVAWALGYHDALERLSAELGTTVEARAGIHLGEVEWREHAGAEVAPAVAPLVTDSAAAVTATRLRAVARARQTLLSRGAFDLARHAASAESAGVDGVEWRSHGAFLFTGFEEPIDICEVGRAGVAPLVAPGDSQHAKQIVPVAESDHYRLLGELGRGGMGVVYRALDTRLGREVALKFLPDETSRSPEALGRFKREARAASALNHPNICTVYDIGSYRGQHFIAMELLEGRSLRERLTEGPLETADALRVGAALADALQVAHEKGIIHRDLKPGNVFLTSRGEAKLLDFGLAKWSPLGSEETTLAVEPDLTRSQRVVGTPGYMSPEQVLGRPLDARTDVFSLGVLLYRATTGRMPFQSTTERGLIDDILHGQPDSITTLNPLVPPALERIVRRCLAKDPEDRYPSMRELHRDLVRLQEGSRPAGVRWSLRARRAAVAAAAVLLVPVLALLVWWRAPGARGPAGAPVLAILPFSNQTGDPEKQYLSDGIRTGLRNELVELSGLRVIADLEPGGGAGVDDGADAAARARRAGAELLLGGEVQERGGRLRVTTHVSSAADGLILWSDVREDELDRFFALQSDIARSMTRFLAIPLSRQERRRLARDPTTSLAAYRQYVEGRRHLEEPTSAASFQTAVDLLTHATRIDPGFALAHATLAQAHWSAYEVNRAPADLEKALAAANTAVELDPDLPDAQVALALVFQSAGRIEDSIEGLHQVLARHPRRAEAHRQLALAYEKAGNLAGAERLLRTATAIDPDDWFGWNRLGAFQFRNGDPSVAREAFARAAELAPAGVTRPREYLAACAIHEGRFDEAIELLEELPAVKRDPMVANNLATAYFFSDRPDRWRRAEELYRMAIETSPERAEWHGNLADVHRAQGRDQEALERYRVAMELAERDARANPEDTAMRGKAALYAAKAGRCDRALPEAASVASESTQRTRESLHLLALVFAVCEERDATLDALREAFASGLQTELVASEAEFAFLAGDQEFQRLVAGVAQN